MTDITHMDEIPETYEFAYKKRIKGALDYIVKTHPSVIASDTVSDEEKKERLALHVYRKVKQDVAISHIRDYEKYPDSFSTMANVFLDLLEEKTDLEQAVIRAEDEPVNNSLTLLNENDTALWNDIAKRIDDLDIV